MKRILCLILCLLMIFSVCACSKNTNTNENENNTTTPIEPTYESADGKTTVDNIVAELISIETNKFDNMCFDKFNKSIQNPSDDGTAFTLLIKSSEKNIFVDQIEKITIKSNKNEIVNMSTRTYVLNNNKACIVFAKTEGKHKASEYAVLVKTYDGEEKLLPISDTVNKDVYKDFVTDLGQAQFGDLIELKDNPYFILQSGSFSSVMYEQDENNYSEVVIGTVLIPLYNKFSPVLTQSDFTTEFFDNDKIGNNGIKTSIKVNDETAKETYKENYAGLFVELITCSFTAETDIDTDVEQVVAKRDYVMNNTWIKGTYKENVLYKPYSTNLPH